MRLAGHPAPGGGEGRTRGARRPLSWEPLGGPVGWPSSFPLGGLALPCSIIVLTSTQVLPTDDANCRVLVLGGGVFTVDVSKPRPNRPNTTNLVEKRA